MPESPSGSEPFDQKSFGRAPVIFCSNSFRCLFSVGQLTFGQVPIFQLTFYWCKTIIILPKLLSLQGDGTKHRGRILASHLAALGLILGVPKNFSLVVAEIY